MPLIPEQPLPIELVGHRRSRNRVRIVCLGGGTGLSMILRGLKHIGSVTAVVTTTDDGGSSGRCRRDFGLPAPGAVPRAPGSQRPPPHSGGKPHAVHGSGASSRPTAMRPA